MCECGTYVKCYCGRRAEDPGSFASRVGSLRAKREEPAPKSEAQPRFREGTINVKLLPLGNGDVQVSATGFNGESLGVGDGENFVWSRYDIIAGTELTLQIPVKLLDVPTPAVGQSLTPAQNSLLWRALRLYRDAQSSGMGHDAVVADQLLDALGQGRRFGLDLVEETPVQQERQTEEPLTDEDRRLLQRGLVKLQQEVATESTTYKRARRLYGRLHAGTRVLLRQSTTSDC